MGARRTLEEEMAAAYAERQRQAALVAEFDADQERRREEKRRTAAQAETEELARTRLSEWLDGGSTEEEFRQVWPQMLAEHYGRKHAAKAAERQKLIDENRIF